MTLPRTPVFALGTSRLASSETSTYGFIPAYTGVDGAHRDSAMYLATRFSSYFACSYYILGGLACPDI